MHLFRLYIVSLTICLAACSSVDTGKEARDNNTISTSSATYALASPVASSTDPTCAENFTDIVSHLEYLVAQKNGGQAAVSP